MVRSFLQFCLPFYDCKFSCFKIAILYEWQFVDLNAQLDRAESGEAERAEPAAQGFSADKARPAPKLN